MKPTVIIIVVVIAILGFLLIYSQQHDMPADQGQAAVSEPAQEPAADSEGAVQDAPAAGGQSSAPSGEHSK